VNQPQGTKQLKKSKKNKRKLKSEDSDDVGTEMERPQPWEQEAGDDDICEPTMEGVHGGDADDGAQHKYATRSKGEVVSVVGIKRRRPPDEGTEIRAAVFMVVEEVTQPTPKKPRLLSS